MVQSMNAVLMCSYLLFCICSHMHSIRSVRVVFTHCKHLFNHRYQSISEISSVHGQQLLVWFISLACNLHRRMDMHQIFVFCSFCRVGSWIESTLHTSSLTIFISIRFDFFSFHFGSLKRPELFHYYYVQ